MTCDESPASIVDDWVFRELTSLNSGLPVYVKSWSLSLSLFIILPSYEKRVNMQDQRRKSVYKYISATYKQFYANLWYSMLV